MTDYYYAVTTNKDMDKDCLNQDCTITIETMGQFNGTVYAWHASKSITVKSGYDTAVKVPPNTGIIVVGGSTPVSATMTTFART